MMQAGRMGINQQVLKAILAENQYRELSGKLLLIGRSTVCLNQEKILKLFSDNRLPKPIFSKTDSKTKHSSDIYNIDDKELFRSVSNKINTIDVLDGFKL